jgi:hypothetical protein
MCHCIADFTGFRRIVVFAVEEILLTDGPKFGSDPMSTFGVTYLLSISLRLLKLNINPYQETTVF